LGIVNCELREGGEMDRRELEERTKIFSINVIQLVTTLPKNKATDVISYQILKSATSIGANYREAARAESKADFIHKIGVVEKEASETIYWLELIKESLVPNDNTIDNLLKECHELLAIFVVSGKTAKRRR
jgi:four helix bundle protein